MNRVFPFLLFSLIVSRAPASEQVLTPKLHHLRQGATPEWSDFPRAAEAPSLRIPFKADANAKEATLRLRQQDVKQTWHVQLNGKKLFQLGQDENDMELYVPVPAGFLIKGENVLLIEQTGKPADDIRVGEISLFARRPAEILSEASVEIEVLEGKEKPTPCRLTVLNAKGALVSLGAASAEGMAVRPGVIYSGTGKARFGLPAGDYTVYAGRGFEYGIASASISVRPGDVVRKTLTIRREVATPGYVACDPHVHTLTYSGHGDATVHEQVLSIAGEGIELPIATEHNRQEDYHDAALKQEVRSYFTPVVGNEVTTAFGHFNIFPVKAGKEVPDHKLKTWKDIFASIDKTTGAKVVILNHARDLHSNFRPFGPGRHLALTGEDLDGWELKANGMEIVNSGAQQTDVMGLVRDWFGLLNRGIHITPVGASDSHDVARLFVGQARTYIRCPDDRPGDIDVAAAVESLRQGRVLVSCGLLTEIAVNAKHGPGDLVAASDDATVTIRVLGPSWVQADRIELYANGYKIREAALKGEVKPGLKWEGVWKLPRFRHDVHLVAVASGPGVKELYWPIAKPYQPTSPVVERRVIGVTGAVWIDGDGDGRKTSAFDYALKLSKDRKVEDAIAALADHDEAVAVQLAGILHKKGASLLEPAVRDAARKAGPHVERGFEAFVLAWRESQVARFPE